MKTRVAFLVCARRIAALAPLLVPAALMAQATQSTDGAYGFVRVVDGSAYLIEAGSGQRSEAQANEPLLSGDHVFVAAGSRAELLLSDRNIVRLTDRAELELPSLAGSPDGQADRTVLRLRRGTLQLLVEEDFVGAFYPTVETPFGTVELASAGSFLVSVESRGTTVTVRSGAADVITSFGSDRAEAGEELFVDASGNRAPRHARAGPVHAIERWGDDLAAAADGQDLRYVDAGLAYAAAPLARYGRWVTVGGRHAWYPHHRSGWRPYWKGHWRHTPTGLLWVSYEPWGWVPYHYGVWDQVPGYGWLWFPGRRFAPAWVAWYWGPAYVGWTPLGFYAGYYGSGFRISIGFGTYGWGYGPAHRFRGFTFVPGHKFGRRHQHKWARRGYDLGRAGHVLDRGIITTDTRRITPPRWRRTADVVRELDDEGRRRRGGRSLPDATPFGGRLQRLPAESGRVAVGGPSSDDRRAGRVSGGSRGDRDPGLGGRTLTATPNRRQPRVTPPTRDRPSAATPGRRTGGTSDSGRRSRADRATDRRALTRGPERRIRGPSLATPVTTPRRSPTRVGPDRSGERTRPGAREGRPTRERVGATPRAGPGAERSGERTRPGARDRLPTRDRVGATPRAGPGAERGRVKVAERPSARGRAAGGREYGRSSRERIDRSRPTGSRSYGPSRTFGGSGSYGANRPAGGSRSYGTARPIGGSRSYGGRRR